MDVPLLFPGVAYSRRKSQLTDLEGIAPISLQVNTNLRKICISALCLVSGYCCNLRSAMALKIRAESPLSNLFETYSKLRRTLAKPKVLKEQILTESFSKV